MLQTRIVFVEPDPLRIAGRRYAREKDSFPGQIGRREAGARATRGAMDLRTCDAAGNESG
jgi:hypothetical protein